MADNWPEVFREALRLPGLLVEVYGDLAKPGVRQVGKALESIIGLGNTLLWPVVLANEKARIALETNLERYREKLKTVPEAEVVPIAPEIGVPIAERLGFVRDDRLCELYLTLLTKASVKGSLAEAHPSFVHAINNLSPDEAILLESFVSDESMAFVRCKAVDSETNTYAVLCEMIVHSSVLARLQFPNNIEAYISNLEGLGILDVRRSERLDESQKYDELVSSAKLAATQVMESHIQYKGRALNFDRCVIAITSYGRLFLKACLAPSASAHER